MDRTLESLIAAAVRAPSGDNTQPWRFAVDEEAGLIALEVDPTRDPSPMNAGQRMARIAVGAALENLLRVAHGRGYAAEVEPGSPPAVAAVRLSGGGSDPAPGEAPIAARVTNRRPYDGRPVAAEVLDRLAGATPELDGVRTHWIVGSDRLSALARLIGRADAVMFGEPTMRRAFLSKVRFDAPASEEVAEGLSLASLELTASDRLALRGMTHTPDWLLKIAGATKVFEAKAKALVASSSGLALVVAPDGVEATDLTVGRAMQRAWLALAAEGLAAQPMMSLCVLENASDHGSPALCESLGRATLAALRDEFRALAPEIGDGRPAFLLRFGSAPPPTGRTGRLAPAAVATTTHAASPVSAARGDGPAH
jgi:nitroreductase